MRLLILSFLSLFLTFLSSQSLAEWCSKSCAKKHNEGTQSFSRCVKNCRHQAQMNLPDASRFRDKIIRNCVKDGKDPGICRLGANHATSRRCSEGRLSGCNHWDPKSRVIKNVKRLSPQEPSCSKFNPDCNQKDATESSKNSGSSPSSSDSSQKADSRSETKDTEDTAETSPKDTQSPSLNVQNALREC